MTNLYSTVPSRLVSDARLIQVADHSLASLDSLAKSLPTQLVESYTMASAKDLEAQGSAGKDSTISPANTSLTLSSSLGHGSNTASSATTYSPDPHAVSAEEARYYYTGLHSKPTLLYRTGKEEWSPPRGPKIRRPSKMLREVFAHPIVDAWNDLGMKVVEVMDAHAIRFTTIDVVRFQVEADDELEDEEDSQDEKDSQDEEDFRDEEGEANEPVIGPVTIWIGVFPESTSATAAHNAAQDVLTLLGKNGITGVDIDFRESYYTRRAGPKLLEPAGDLDPLLNVISPLTPALGLHISTKANLKPQGTMALYLAEGGVGNRLLGLSCRHVLIKSSDANMDYVRHRSGPSKDVVLLGKKALANLGKAIQSNIEAYTPEIPRWKKQIAKFEEREKGTDAVAIKKAEAARIGTQELLRKGEEALEALKVLHDRVNKEWAEPDNRVLGHILCSPAISLGVGEEHFTEDWAIFEVDRAKLGDGFQGNKMDLGTEMSVNEFTRKCFPRGDANWRFEYPEDRLLPLENVITDKLMREPDMWDSDKKPCLLVVKNGGATGTTIGRANGVFSIVRIYFIDMFIHQTSMEWAILNYGSKSKVFSKGGDSGSIIADIRGRIGGMLTGGAGERDSSDITYATPWWWLHGRIKGNGFPNAHLGVNGNA